MPFANPYGVAALVLFPALLALALVGRYVARRRVARWGGDTNIRALALLPAREWDLIRSACLWVALGLCFVAFARPQWGEVVESVQKVGLDVVVLLDTSRSMDVTDVQPSRLERAKLEVRSFLNGVEGDRVGLVAFSGVPLTLSPLTEDTGAVSLLLDIADTDLIPAQGTAVGKGIEEALRLLPQPHDRDQVILLLSDGEDQGHDAVVAARTAARLGVKIFCVGVGTPLGGPVPGPDGRPMEDPATGQRAVSRLDEAALRQISAIADGRYWTLAGAGSVVPQIEEELGHLKRKEYASRAQARREDQFAWFLAPAAALLLLWFLLPSRRKPDQGVPAPQAAGRGPAKALLLAALVLGSVPYRAQAPARLAADASGAYAAGKYELALGLYRKALQEAESPALKPVLHYNVGTCLLALRRFPEARDELTLALAGQDSLVANRAYYNLAQAFQGDGNRDQALATLRILLSADPVNRDAQMLYEWILRQKPPQPPPPPKSPPPPQPQAKPPDLLEQLPMPPPKELQDQVRPPEAPSPGMKPW